jgi:hypothetical protein
MIGHFISRQALRTEAYFNAYAWPAADPLVGLLEHRRSRTRGSGADGGAHTASWFSVRRRAVYSIQAGRLTAILDYNAAR